MRSEQKITRLFICPYRKLAFVLVVATVSASTPLAGLTQSYNGTAITAQSHAPASQEQRSPVAFSSSLDGLPDEPMPHGQQEPSGAPTNSTGRAQTQSESDPEAGSPPLRFARALGIFPVAEADSASAQVAPLSTAQKFEFFIKPTFDPSIAVVAAVGTALSAKSTTQPAYGGGAAAYGQKARAITADYAANNLFSKAILPSVLHQDPRFFLKQRGSVGSRLMYGVSRTFLTRTDGGQSTLNTSFLGGLAATVALSNAYYPDRNRNAVDSATRYGEDIGVDMVRTSASIWWST
jgi:hypothetical protein